MPPNRPEPTGARGKLQNRRGRVTDLKDGETTLDLHGLHGWWWLGVVRLLLAVAAVLHRLLLAMAAVAADRVDAPPTTPRYWC